MNEDGTEPMQLTHSPKQGQWGNANHPFGDYDPRLSPDGQKIIFSRLENDSSPHGNYNFFTVNIDGSGETRLTNTGYTQCIASWSNSGDEIVFIVSAIDDQGKYDIYMMNSDGSNYRDITPDYFPNDFLCYPAIFSNDDSSIYFIGQWWE
jgi:TolB protein